MGAGVGRGSLLLETLRRRSEESAAQRCTLKDIHARAIAAQSFLTQSGNRTDGYDRDTRSRHLRARLARHSRNKETHPMKALPLMLAAMAAISIAAPVMAADTPSRTVDFRPAELNSESGRQAIEERLANAARQVCREPGLRGLARQASEARCREAALQDALGELHASGHIAARAPATTREARIVLTSTSR
ncbi:MAG TPA: hypothetical protein DF715_16410 [Oceanicaulis sp.]|nr:UrcA family protein [Synechococcus moorigangaii CMS01]HCY57016.1 hypothetical protein [Oceanicaulis sp.]